MFVTYYTPTGQLEHKLHAVILNNLSLNFFLEIAITVIPLYFHYRSPMTSFTFGLIKLVRYGRLFEMDSTIADLIEKQAETKTVYELK